MSEERYRIETDPAHGLFRITVQGFWDLGTVDQFRQAFMAAETAAPPSIAGPQTLRVLIDARSMRAQSQEVTAALQTAFVPERGQSTKSAVVVQSALLRIQLQRVTQGERRLFEDEHTATEWLLSDEHGTGER